MFLVWKKQYPRIRQYKHATLPVQLSDAQISEALKLYQSERAVSLRNRAILLLLLNLGIRAKEVIELRLEDIDWIEGKLTIRSSKSLRQRSLPLPVQVGKRLLITCDGVGPPRIQDLFSCVQPPPNGRLTSSSAISSIVHRSLSRAGICLSRMGAHVFRHTAATRMLCGGASFKDIADVLGHQSIESTAIYAKLDLRSLEGVALPGREVNDDRSKSEIGRKEVFGNSTQLGRRDRRHEKLLSDFCNTLVGRTFPAEELAQEAFQWACSTPRANAGSSQAFRLSVVRGFLCHVKTIYPETQIPSKGLIQHSRRRAPYIFSEHEILRLMEMAESLIPFGSLRPQTYLTIIGLLSCTVYGKRSSPAQNERRAA